MNYELAKQLKEAGFPLNMSDHLECDYNHTEFINGIWYHISTLSELIEACGDFAGLFRRKDDKLGQTVNWMACNFGYKSQIMFQCEGSTPEEASANLWLETNKK